MKGLALEKEHSFLGAMKLRKEELISLPKRRFSLSLSLSGDHSLLFRFDGEIENKEEEKRMEFLNRGGDTYTYTYIKCMYV